MGVDIHLNFITSDGKYLVREMDLGRNTEWFDNLQGRGSDPVYTETFTFTGTGLPDVAPDGIKADFYIGDYYGFNYCLIEDFKKWFEAVQPHIKAGWVTTYRKWLYEKKHININDEVLCYLPEDGVGDYQFIEYRDEYEPSLKLYSKILGMTEEERQGYIIFYFDC